MTGSIKGKFSSNPKTQNLKESETRWLSCNPTELCDRVKILLQGKEAVSNSFFDEIAATSDTILEYKCKQMKQYRCLLI